MPTSVSGRGKITSLFILQFCIVLIAISAVALRPGPWNAARLVGFFIAIPAAVFLFTARWQLGKFFRDSTGARTCNLGHLLKDQKPDLRVQRAVASGRPDCVAISLCADPAAGADPDSDRSRPPGGKGSRGV